METFWTSATGAWLGAATLSAWSDALTEGQRRRLNELHGLGREVLAAGTEDERDRRWHDLLFAVGNMKRSAGNIHPPGTWLKASPLHGGAPTSVIVPYGSTTTGTEKVVSRDTPDSWLALQDHVHGLAAPTTSMVLTSLWPLHHATFDRLTRLMLGALTWGQPTDPSRPHPPRISLTSYSSWYLPQMRSIATQLELDLWVVERGLFCFAQRALTGRKPPLSWDEARGWTGLGQQASYLLEHGPT